MVFLVVTVFVLGLILIWVSFVHFDFDIEWVGWLGGLLLLGSCVSMGSMIEVKEPDHQKGSIVYLKINEETKGQILNTECSTNQCDYEVRLEDGTTQMFDEVELVSSLVESQQVNLFVETHFNNDEKAAEENAHNNSFDPNRGNPYAR